MTVPIRQIAYFTADVRAAALAHHQGFGSGPFIVIDHVPLARSEHRGVARPLDHSSAYGQWGDIMIEFVQQHNPDPSAYHDLYPAGSGRFGLHHLAMFVPDLDAAIAAFARDGLPLAHYAETTTGTAFAFVDATARHGHMFELYEPADALTAFYAMIADAAKGWDGRDVIRSLG